MGLLFHVEWPWKVSDEKMLATGLKDLEEACPRQREQLMLRLFILEAGGELGTF